MLENCLAEVPLAFVEKSLLWIQAYMSVDDGNAPAHRKQVFEKREYVRSVQMVEDAQTEDDIESPVFLFTEVADVIVMKLDIAEGERSGGKPCFLKICLSAFDGAHAGAVSGELYAIHALQTRQVQ